MLEDFSDNLLIITWLISTTLLKMYQGKLYISNKITMNMKLKEKSSARVKRVYLLLEARSRGDVEKSVLDYIGVLGWAKASPLFVEGGKKEGRMILSIDRGEINNVRAAFEISPMKIKILKVSGTIKGLD